MLIQATDFAHLHRTMGVELQMGGADQWGNLTAGLELIRRTTAEGAANSGTVGEQGRPSEPAFALAYPLLLTPSGAKFGKSEGGESVWLHRDGTSPFAFYQHWLNTDDRDVSTYLRWFTTFTPAEIEALEAELAARPEARGAQRALAYDISARTHGRDEADRAVSASEAAFSGRPIEDPAVLATLHAAADGFEYRAAEVAAGAVPFLVSTGTFSSNGEARRMITGGGITVNGLRLASPEDRLPEPIAGEWMVIRVGKRKLRIGRRAG
jgi:tyrosyl-tRNA synthetase